MNSDFLRRNRGQIQILLTGLFLIALIISIYVLMSREAPDAAELERHASSTGTALALTSDALLGPFPTSTAPTATISETPTLTPTATRTPTRTRTPTMTAISFITFTARTDQPRVTFTSTSRPPTSTPRPPTNTPRPTSPPRTSTPQPTTYP